MTRKHARALMGLLMCMAFLLTSLPAEARPGFAQATGNPCSVCHISPMGGGPLTAKGEAFRESLSDLSAPLDPKLRVSNAQRLLHVLFYVVHILFGVTWVGMFLFVFRPGLGGRSRYLAIPANYARQLFLSMAVIVTAGPFLLSYKVRTIPGLLTTRFGLLLLLKIAAVSLLFLATAVLLWHGTVAARRRYRKLSGALERGESLDLDGSDLSLFSGGDGRGALTAVDGSIYDVSGRDLWRSGRHPGGHMAGQNLSDLLAKAPHGREVFERVRRVGSLLPEPGGGKRSPLSWAVLLGVAASAVILAVVALWRW